MKVADRKPGNHAANDGSGDEPEAAAIIDHAIRIFGAELDLGAVGEITGSNRPTPPPVITI